MNRICFLYKEGSVALADINLQASHFLYKTQDDIICFDLTKSFIYDSNQKYIKTIIERNNENTELDSFFKSVKLCNIITHKKNILFPINNIESYISKENCCYNLKYFNDKNEPKAVVIVLFSNPEDSNITMEIMTEVRTDEYKFQSNHLSYKFSNNK